MRDVFKQIILTFYWNWKAKKVIDNLETLLAKNLAEEIKKEIDTEILNDIIASSTYKK